MVKYTGYQDINGDCFIKEMTEPEPTYQTSEPSECEQQAAAHWYMIMQQTHEVGMMARRQLELMNALPSGNRLFQTRQEQRLERPE